MAKQVINVGSSANDGTGDKNRIAFQKINANFTELYDAIPTAKQYKFLLSQSGGDDPQTATSGTLTQGVTYEIVAFETGDDFTPSGAPNNTVGTKWIANGVAPTWGNGSELGWNNGAPYVVNKRNTIGNVWFERVTIGWYNLKSDGLFDVDKTFIPQNRGLSLPDAENFIYAYAFVLIDSSTIRLTVADSTTSDFVDSVILNASLTVEIL